MTADPRPKPLRWLLFATVIALFLGTRTYVLYRLHIPWSDVPLYAEYARDYADAARAGQSFYEFHAQAVRTRLAAQSPALPPEAIHWREHIEYPPLAISWMRFATGLLGRSSSPESFCRSYRFSMALTDMACLIILLWLVRRIHGHEPPIRQAVRMSLFVLWGAILGHLLYDRLDLTLALILLASFALLIAPIHYAWSFLTLALGVGFKLVPTVLAPLWIVASLPGNSLDRPWTRATWFHLSRQVAARILWLTVMIPGCFAPALIRFGAPAMGFARYQMARGIEIESLFASAVFVLRTLGRPFRTIMDIGCIEVNSPAADFFARLSQPLTLLLLAVAFIVFLWRLLALTADNPPAPVASRLAQAYPSLFLKCMIVLLLTFIAACKAFSPQYLLWVVPLMPLVSRDHRLPWLTFALFTVICLLTSLIWPWWFPTHVIGAITIASDAVVCSGPTRRGMLLLIVRNALFGVLILYLLATMARKQATLDSTHP